MLTSFQKHVRPDTHSRSLTHRLPASPAPMISPLRVAIKHLPTRAVRSSIPGSIGIHEHQAFFRCEIAGRDRLRGLSNREMGNDRRIKRCGIRLYLPYRAGGTGQRFGAIVQSHWRPCAISMMAAANRPAFYTNTCLRDTSTQPRLALSGGAQRFA